MPQTKESEYSADKLLLLDIFTTKKNLFDKVWINAFAIICFATTTLLTLTICGVTFFRYIVQGDLYGYEEWVKLFAFWLYFSGAAIGAWNRSHVSADLVTAYVHNRAVRRFLTFLRCLVTTAVCGLFTWYAWKFFSFGYFGPLGTGVAIPKTTMWRIPYWVGYLSVFTGLFFMTLYFLRDLIISTRKLFRRSK